ncbi:hypothetical protein H0266_04720 [Halobacillus locisalis]|uniref:Uncharacterized protein n=1 Tax=Halobacillus locisalis TaxID=220753 RepID=A0A838CQQ9_9BACI|nr:hypothetical protein [Halobacillus locisalis]MBA2174203.1 hypothetical protein [Halobacillus locisalis]
MKRLMLGILLVVLSGCINQTSTVDGKAYFVKEDERTFILEIGTTLTEKEQETNDYEDGEKVIEAIRIEVNDETAIKGEASAFNDLTNGQKLQVVVEGDYEEELVTAQAFIDQTSEVATYVAEKVTVIPYKKEEVIGPMTADEGEYHLYVYNAVKDSAGNMSSYSSFIEGTNMTEVSVSSSSPNGPDKKGEFLNIRDEGPTYIVLNDEGIVHHSYELKSLKAFLETLREDDHR